MYKNLYSQQDVAEKTGINVITLSGYELARSEPNMEALVRLADVYHVTLDYLMCRTDTKE
ncbi:MAG: XRE family transcriptional regulator [Clostridiales bacterium]|nr:XRE family transcriptional regulator [Clostridiales bacterium]